jgi:hypothetical protein
MWWKERGRGRPPTLALGPGLHDLRGHGCWAYVSLVVVGCLCG